MSAIYLTDSIPRLSSSQASSHDRPSPQRSCEPLVVQLQELHPHWSLNISEVNVDPELCSEWLVVTSSGGEYEIPMGTSFPHGAYRDTNRALPLGCGHDHHDTIQSRTCTGRRRHYSCQLIVCTPEQPSH